MFRTSLKIVVATVLLLGLPTVAVSQFQSPLLDSRKRISKPKLPKLTRKIELQGDKDQLQSTTIVPPGFQQQPITPPVNVVVPPKGSVVAPAPPSYTSPINPPPIEVVVPPNGIQQVPDWWGPSPGPIEVAVPPNGIKQVPGWWSDPVVPGPGPGPTPPGPPQGPGTNPPGLGSGPNPPGAPGLPPGGPGGNPGVDPAPYMNLPLDQAILKAMLNNKTYRISRINQHGFPMTMDLQPNRLTFQVDNGVVTNATAG